MKLLSKIGKVALQVTSAIIGFGPLAHTVVPQHGGTVTSVIDTVTQIRAIIVQAEIMGQALGLPGEQKLRAAAPAVAQIILMSDVLAGRKIDDPALFHAGVTKITDGMADILNSLEDKIETESHA